MIRTFELGVAPGNQLYKAPFPNALPLSSKSMMQDLSRTSRWRLILGQSESNEPEPELQGDAQAMDETMAALYDYPERKGGLGDSAPQIRQWLGDIQTYFPTSIVQLMQRDALNRLGLAPILREPDLLNLVIPDAHLVSVLLSLSRALPDEAREGARTLVNRYVEELLKRLEAPLLQSVRGSLYRLSQTRRPELREMDWPRTIYANLRHYQPEWKTIIPERLFGRRRNSRQAHSLFLLVDQSGSMGPSVVHAGILGAVLATLPSLQTRLVAFDTQVADLSAWLDDPVELLFAAHLGGGTDIGQALAFAQQQIEQPESTTLVLISDLAEGADPDIMFTRFDALLQKGVQVIILLSLDDHGTPSYEKQHAKALAQMNIPVFACTPDRFPDLMAAALERRPLAPLSEPGSGLVQKN